MNGEDIRNTFNKKLDLTGSLEIEDFNNLTSVNLKKLKLVTSLVITNCSQLNNIDLFELATLKSLSVSNCPKLTKFDCSQLTELIELKLDVSNLNELDCSNTSIEELSLELCSNITKLDCSNNHKLINLDISNCSELKSLDCSYNQLTSLNLRSCSKLESLNCFHCSKLEYVDCSLSKLTKLDLSNCPNSIKVVPSNLNITRDREGIKNLLIVGRTGSGKTTLVNTLTKNEEYAVSGETRYRMIDTDGGENIVKTIKKILDETTGFLVREGISQVLLVIDGKLTADKIKELEISKDFIIKNGVIEYITIVRTKFNGFKVKEECEKDKKKICEENEAIAEIVNSCRGVVYVDNPPINVLADDMDDDDKKLIEINKKIREKSTIILLNHLDKVCQETFRK